MGDVHISLFIVTLLSLQGVPGGANQNAKQSGVLYFPSVTTNLNVTWKNHGSKEFLY
jgi:hypothetical protein